MSDVHVISNLVIVSVMVCLAIIVLGIAGILIRSLNGTRREARKDRELIRQDVCQLVGELKEVVLDIQHAETTIRTANAPTEPISIPPRSSRRRRRRLRLLPPLAALATLSVANKWAGGAVASVAAIGALVAAAPDGVPLDQPSIAQSEAPSSTRPAPTIPPPVTTTQRPTTTAKTSAPTRTSVGSQPPPASSTAPNPPPSTASPMTLPTPSRTCVATVAAHPLAELCLLG